MRDLDREFEQVVQRVSGLSFTQLLESRLLEYGPEYIRSFDSEVDSLVDLQGRPVEIVHVVDEGYRLHSTHQPAAWSNRYFLFGEEMTRQSWFRVLGYTPEEQIIHRLKWE